MKKTLCTLAVALTSAVLLNAQTYDFTITFEPTEAAGATGSGSGTLTFDSITSELTFNNITYSGMTGNSTLAHIHGPLPSTSVIYNLEDYTTFGSTSGSFDGTLELVDGTGGHSLSDQVNQLLNNQWYINIHSSVAGGGELAGTIELVPEPSTFALLGLGAAGLVCWRLRRRH